MATKKGAPRASAGPASVAKSHRAFQPILPCGNKLLQQKWDQTYYDQHRKLITAAKPMVDSKPPASRPHVTSKLKKQQLEKERYDEIDRDNMTLLHKMQHIMKTQGCVDHRNMYRHHSLNEEHRRREQERVVRENRSMLKRLEGTKPMYRVSDWINDWQRKEELTHMITAYPQDPGIPAADKIKKKEGTDESPKTASEKDDTGKEEESSTTQPQTQNSNSEEKQEDAKAPSEVAKEE